ncbi:MAG: pilus assembly protein PilM [Candidatus Paceibacterota bacterium]
MFKKIWQKLTAVFKGAEKVGGIEISHEGIKYLVTSKGTTKINQTQVQLPAGTIQQGAVKNKEQLIEALKKVHAQIAPNEKTEINVNLIVSSGIVFAQPFSVPILPEQELQEAINLNAQMISPHPIDQSYYGWQEIERSQSKASIHLLGAFAKADIIQEYESALQSAGFHVFSIEFPAVSLARLVASRWQKISEKNHYLALYINSEGVLMTILKNKSLYFSHFTPWSDIISQQETEQQEITFAKVKDFIRQEIQRVINFYVSRHSAKLENALLISPIFNYELVEMLKKEFQMEAKNLTLSDLPNLSPSWFPALGAALRDVSQAEQTITLSKTTARQEYSEERTLIFFRVWRKFIFTPLVFIFILFLALDSLAFMLQRREAPEISRLSAEEEAKLQELTEDAAEFNSLLAQAKSLSDEESRWSEIIIEVESLAGEDITISRIFADDSNMNILINATTKSEEDAIAFKNRLIAAEDFENVNLPLSNLQIEATGLVTFTLTMHLRVEIGEGNQEE